MVEMRYKKSPKSTEFGDFFNSEMNFRIEYLKSQYSLLISPY